MHDLILKCCRAGCRFFRDEEIEKDLGASMIQIKLIIKYSLKYRALYFDLVPESHNENQVDFIEQTTANNLV